MKVSLLQLSQLPVTLKLVPCMTSTRGQHLLGIDSINFLTLFRDIVSLSCSNIWQSWTSVWGGGWRLHTRLSKWSQRCSIGFKSGELEGHGSIFILFCSRQFIAKRAVRGLALSCWNNFLCRPIKCMRWGRIFSSLYLTAVNLPGTCTSSVFSIIWDRRPHHDTTSTVAIHFLNTGGRETIIPAPVYSYSAISFLQEKTRIKP